MTIGGSIRSVSINGTSYNVASEADLTESPTYTTETDEHSGGSSFLITKRNATVEGVELSVDAIDQENLLDLADPEVTPAPYPLSYTEADGTVKTADGRINIESRSTANARIKISMMPSGGRWNVFSP